MGLNVMEGYHFSACVMIKSILCGIDLTVACLHERTFPTLDFLLIITLSE